MFLLKPREQGNKTISSKGKATRNYKLKSHWLHIRIQSLNLNNELNSYRSSVKKYLSWSLSINIFCEVKYLFSNRKKYLIFFYLNKKSIVIFVLFFYIFPWIHYQYLPTSAFIPFEMCCPISPSGHSTHTLQCVFSS